MSDRINWGNIYTTVHGGGKFLEVTDTYECKGPGCQVTSYGNVSWPSGSHGLKMKEFDPSIFNDPSFQWNIDPATQRPMIDYKGNKLGMDFQWNPFPGTNANAWLYAPYVTSPNEYQTSNFNTLYTEAAIRNFNGYYKKGTFGVSGVNAGLCYNPSVLKDYPITVGGVQPQQDGPSWPGKIWPAASKTPGCEWIDFNSVYGCCAEIGFADNNPMCSTDPNGYSQNGSLPCQNIMLKMCENNWTQEACAAYLQSFENGNGIKDVSTVFQKAIANYINGQSERTGCGPNDYTSPKLGSSCKMPNGQIRDDSKDTFIYGTMLNFCSLNAASGVCDNILNQYCSQFTREDLNTDAALQRLCGCHMSDGSPLAPGTTPLKLSDNTRQPDQYLYPGVSKACDPLCSFSGTLQSAAPQCSHTVCIMDDVGIQLINSNCGNVNISQVCGPSYDGTDATGYCYMSNIDVDSINSSCGGAAISQHCKACFSFTPGDPSSAVPVDCKNPSGKPYPGGGGGSNPPTGGGSGVGFFSWLKEHANAIGASIMILGILLIIIGIIIYFIHAKDISDAPPASASESTSTELDSTFSTDKFVKV